MKIKEFIIKFLGIEDFDKSYQDEIADIMIKITTEKTMQELMIYFDKDEIDFILSLQKTPEDQKIIIEKYGEKIKNFNSIFNLKLKETLNEYAKRISRS